MVGVVGSVRWIAIGLALALAIALAPTVAWAGGKLGSVRSEVSGGSSSSSSSSGGSRGSGSSSSSSRGSTSSSSSSSSSSWGSSSNSHVGWGAASATSTGYSASCCYGIQTDGYRPPPRRSMLRFPYENDYDGYNVRADESPVHGKPWAFNAGTEGAYMFDGVWRGAV